MGQFSIGELCRKWVKIRLALTEQVAVKAGYQANGGGFNNALGRSRILELVQGRGELRASDNFFESGTA